MYAIVATSSPAELVTVNLSAFFCASVIPVTTPAAKPPKVFLITRLPFSFTSVLVMVASVAFTTLFASLSYANVISDACDFVTAYVVESIKMLVPHLVNVVPS